MKISMKSFVCIVLFVSAACISVAQTSTVTKIVKFKPPVVKSFLGENTNGATVTKEDASHLIELPLTITDNAKNSYTIDSYRFIYKRKSVIEDEETGKKSITFTTVSDNFKVTPLPKVWIDNLKDGFQKDEEIHFFDIIVKDKNNRKFFAPDLQINIQ